MFSVPTSGILILEVWSGAQQSTQGDSSGVGGSQNTLGEALTGDERDRPFSVFVTQP